MFHDFHDVLPPLGVQLNDYHNYGNYDLLTSHMLFLPSLNFLKHYMNPTTKYITILRKPEGQWLSAFHFFCFHGMSDKPNNLFISRLETFFQDPDTEWTKLHGQCHSYTKNGMWFDLTSEMSNRTSANNTIFLLDTHLDLVLISEYFDESLLLLKKMMCWDYNDILYLKMNQRKVTSDINNLHRFPFKQWNALDAQLYDHFNRTLWSNIEHYGVDFKRDLLFFRQMLNSIYLECDIKETHRPERKNILYFYSGNQTTFCQNLVQQLTKDYVKRQQTEQT